MSKRFTDTEKYRKGFVKGLRGPYKLLWDYLYCECNHAGIWYNEFEVAQLRLGSDMPVNEKEALKFFNENVPDHEKRIIVLNGGSKWFIRPFVEFQYGVLDESNRVHKSVINELLKAGVAKDLVRALQGCKDKDKAKDKDKDKEKDKDLSRELRKFRALKEKIGRGVAK